MRKNHVDQLSSCLASYLNGILNTPLCLSRVHMMNTSQDEVTEIFDLHSRYISKLQRLSLSSHILQLDRIRTEKATGTLPAIDRSARSWAASLTDDDGKNLQCDVVSGSLDRQVYLLAPIHHLQRVKNELKEYMERILHLRPSTVIKVYPIYRSHH